ncbi:MAG: 5,10-methylenetetrahydromethanopterin reductase [Halodesulfurarchaeum sp.]
MNVDNTAREEPAFRWGVELTPEMPVGAVTDLAELTESNGFDAVFVSNHYNNRDPFVALSRIAGATDSIRLGPGVANPYETHPVKLAAQMGTLHEASGKRAVFGVGAGDPSTLSNMGIDRDRPLGTVRETVQVARRLWAGERVTHDGTFTAVDAALNYEPGPIPAYVGAQGPQMLRMTAKHADGVLFNGSHPRDYEWARERIETGLADRPASAGEFTIAGFASVSIAADGAKAKRAARPPVSYIVAGAPDAVLDRHDLDVTTAEAIGTAIESGNRDRAYDLVTPEMIDAFSIAGDPNEVEEEIRGLFDTVDAVVAASPLGPDREDAISLLGDVRESILTKVESR